MAIEVLTKDDLNQFKNELFAEISLLVMAPHKTKQKWLKSKEVLELLTISPGTLQNLRINGTLSFTKIGGTIYYDQEDINKILERNKKAAKLTLFK
ncbi:helix-turn-helix domain-containing protein [Flavobacterium sp. TSSA_36]|uniref:helix-turn-helix domain-containing protein n=1 Tax=Flavobacterium sp. TSSA_36 TaxID=3447669 RepID=UPI003F326BBA